MHEFSNKTTIYNNKSFCGGSGEGGGEPGVNIDGCISVRVTIQNRSKGEEKC